MCGGREFKAKRLLWQTLDLLHADKPITKVVQGYARGADRLAHSWALSRGIKSTYRRYEITDEMWRRQGRAAGYHRNKRMRDEQLPDIVVAFPGGPGTKMMVNLANEKELLVLTVAYDGTIT